MGSSTYTGPNFKQFEMNERAKNSSSLLVGASIIRG